MIRLSKSAITTDDISAVSEVLTREFLGQGEFTKAFEQALSTTLGASVATTSSGTSALQLALQASGVGVGDEVLVPTVTYVASYQAISAVGATPVSCEVDSQGMLCLDKCTHRVTSKTKTIMLVNFRGTRSYEKAAIEFAKKNGLKLIIDAAHSFGSTLDFVGEKILPDATYCFSFDGIKNITCGEGGAICSFDEELCEYVKTVRALGISGETTAKYNNERVWSYDVTAQGWRYHLQNMNAALGLSQLSRLSSFRKIRQTLAGKYNDLLRPLDTVELFEDDFAHTLPHIYPIKFKNPELKYTIKKRLLANDVQVGQHYFPNHLLTKYKTKYRLPIAEDLVSRMLTLPLHPDLSEEDLRFIVSLIGKD